MSDEPITAPYGTWDSPITPESLAENVTSIQTVLVDKVTKEIYYIESRPSEGGRQVIVRLKDQKDIFGKDFNARTGVIEYGGVPATVHDGIIYFSNFTDSRVYKVKEGEDPVPVTPDNSKWRYAELTVIPQHPNLIIAVFEDDTSSDPAKVIDKLVAINTLDQSIQTIAEGADFYNYPRLSPNERKLVWNQWSHPDMPFTGSELVLADFSITNDSITVTNPKVIAGKKGAISVQQPTWLSDDRLLFMSDESKFLNPWTYTVSTATAKINVANGIHEDFCELTWSLGLSDYAALSSSRVVHVSYREDLSAISIWDLDKGTYAYVSTPYSNIVSVQPLGSTEAVFIGTKTNDSPAIVKITIKDVGDEPQYDVLKSTWSGELPRELISIPKIYVFPVPPDNKDIHVTYYPPHNPKYKPREGELPPALVSLHGGPTSRSDVLLKWAFQFWTSRGWAILDVNYGGSSGYGRDYMDRLKTLWGVVDISDTIEAIIHFGDEGIIDSRRIAIRGSSSSGLTSLGSLIKDPPLIGAGTSSYGVTDLLNLEKYTHKFESHYFDYVLGGSSSQIPLVYTERSPITHADKIKTPLLILQGLDDVIVPPQQSKEMAEKIEAAGGTVKYITFEGEGHGWRKATTIIAAQKAELEWYNGIFKF